MQLKKEVTEAHKELRALYEELRGSHESLDTVDVEELNLNSDFKPGCLTTFVKNFKDVLEEFISDNSTRATVSTLACRCDYFHWKRKKNHTQCTSTHTLACY